jgi:hypothetical protein
MKRSSTLILVSSPDIGTIVTGHRDMADQNKAFNAGKSQLRFPNSRHNSHPSEAFDIIPYPSGWSASYEEWFELATYVLRAGLQLGVDLEWGGHWKNFTGKGDKDRDWAHFEISQ